MSAEPIDYPTLVQEALRGVVRRCLLRTRDEGLPNAHHFYITFRTGHPGVELAEHLREGHPEEMTIALQHEFWGLEVEDDAFEVSLRFQGQPQRLRVPFAAISAFVDPSVEFGLRFQLGEEEPPAPAPPKENDGESEDRAESASADEESGRVVAFDPDRRR